MKNNQLATIEQINAQYGKLPPQAVEVEEAVLGALMLEEDAYDYIEGIISESSFYKEEHQNIFSTIHNLRNKGTKIDLLTVTQELKDNDKLDKVGGPGYITQLTSRVASAAHIEFHAKIIAVKYYKREVIRLASEVQTVAYDDTVDVDDISSFLSNQINELENIFTIADTGTHINDVLDIAIDEIEQDSLRIKAGNSPGIPTGLVGLDTNTGGWRNGDLIYLAARPGVGKTSMALHFAISAAEAGYWVNIFSYEMTKQALVKILLARESKIPRSDIRDGYIKDHQWEILTGAISKLKGLNILFKDASGMNAQQLRSAVHRNKKNGKCDLVIVDYLQLVKSTNKKEIREQEVAEISLTLKGITQSENIPVIALSQLNREADKGIPKLSNLRESGAIEQDADIVMFLMRDVENDEIIRMMIAKHRNGKLGDMELYPNKEMTNFKELEDHSQEIDENWYNKF